MRELLIKGGPIFIIILLLSILAFTLVIERIYYLFVFENEDVDKIKNEVKNFLVRNDLNGAKAYLTNKKGSVSFILNFVLDRAGQNKSVIEDKIKEKLIIRTIFLEKYLWIISLISQLEPLLGLLGTVTGMMQVFNVISISGNADPSKLSGGIAEALITTAGGLFITVPLSLLYSFIDKKVEVIIGNMESASLDILNIIKGD